MNKVFRDGRLKAAGLAGANRLTEATARLQQILQDKLGSGGANASGGQEGPIIDGVAETGETAHGSDRARTGPAAGMGSSHRPSPSAGNTAQSSLPQALRSLLDQVNRGGFQPPQCDVVDPPAGKAPPVVPDGARFLAAKFSNQAGTRPYKLYVPSGYSGQPVPLIVMLHGCTQSPDDFAAGTRMNGFAEEHTCLVAYPAQTTAGNSQRCWNWFSPDDQLRGQGEPSLIAGITREIMGAWRVDPRRVYVAGLSAGAAAAVIMGSAYPELYAAIGVHSGLPCGAASDLPSAFAAMRQGTDRSGRRAAMEPRANRDRRVIPAIVFHGDRDSTVHPSNGDAVLAQLLPAVPLATERQSGRVPGGHAYTRTLHVDANGSEKFESWVIHSAGHAWAGGSPAGSFTDPRGPDASREMMRFFLDHPRPSTSG
ncbi:MAG: PHB depolymerase family esterase [Pseudomonadota bacterium]|nr:PHB depolymerase family esterase [Pseudomonadota bacterium]